VREAFKKIEGHDSDVVDFLTDNHNGSNAYDASSSAFGSGSGSASGSSTNGGSGGVLSASGARASSSGAASTSSGSSTSDSTRNSTSNSTRNSTSTRTSLKSSDYGTSGSLNIAKNRMGYSELGERFLQACEEVGLDVREGAFVNGGMDWDSTY
jgi:hypothetical protein